MVTQEERVVRRYFQTFNRQDIEGLMECFHENPVLVGADGRRIEGRAEVRRCYEASFASFPDGRCQLRTCTGNSGHLVAESRFLGIRQRDDKVVEAIGAEMIEIVDGKIKEIRDYHERVRAAAVDRVAAAAAVE
ncbi:MAG: nuclear transport factor 2 family protein [Candidatus Binataceae bacterium]|nr:nuclear transport factor 2 family protein [Candidatus Binataceae bacterium]